MTPERRLRRRTARIRPSPGPPSPPRGRLAERRNYRFQPEVADYELWPYSTIDWAADQDKYKARVIVRDRTTGDHVAFNSWHEDLADAERAIALVSASLRGAADPRVYNIFGETMDVHPGPREGGRTVIVVEVLALTWSMQETPRP